MEDKITLELSSGLVGLMPFWLEEQINYYRQRIAKINQSNTKVGIDYWNGRIKECEELIHKIDEWMGFLDD